MALKTLMLRRSIDMKKVSLEELRAKDAEFQRREAELEAAINEATTQEEQDAVSAEVDTFEADKGKHEKAKSDLVADIEKLERELAEAEGKEPTRDAAPKPEKRKDEVKMNTNAKFFGMSGQERDSFFARTDVKEFLQRVRDLGHEKRTITGGELLIPTVVLNLLRENVTNYSKLYKHVNVRSVPGKARQTVMGTVPEAVWTEMCAKLNELNLSFTSVEVDGYKVGGFIAVCNAVLEDSDIALATEIISALGQAIGLALDKAILYGTGTKMPLGIVTRLVQTEKPSDTANTVPWTDLSATNVIAISGKTDAALFKAMVTATGAAKGKYSRGSKFWAMNETTYTSLISNALTINAAGAIVSGIGATMPIIGGTIEVLSFIPDGVMIGGYGDLYLLAERAGAAIAQSEHVRFLEDQTVFKGTARYDGLPVIAEGFVAIGLNGTAPTADAVTFAEDTANKAA